MTFITRLFMRKSFCAVVDFLQTHRHKQKVTQESIWHKKIKEYKALDENHITAIFPLLNLLWEHIKLDTTKWNFIVLDENTMHFPSKIELNSFVEI